MNEPRKCVFLPSGFEAGMKRGYPVIVYVSRSTTIDGKCYLVGSQHLADVRAGRGMWLRESRAMPFSDAVWHLCEKHIEHRKAVEDEYAGLLKIARKAKA